MFVIALLVVVGLIGIGLTQEDKSLIRLAPSEAQAEAHFGYSVALSGNGLVVVVGAPKHQVQGLVSGAVFVYSRDNVTSDVWTERHMLTPPQPGSQDEYRINARFGHSVSVDALGMRVAVGAPMAGYVHEGQMLTGTGVVWVFVRDSDQALEWQPAKMIVPALLDEKAAGDEFGRHVSLSHDGSLLAVGAPRVDAKGMNDTGAAYVFTWSLGDHSWWRQLTKVTADTTIHMAAASAQTGGEFGSSVAMVGAARFANPSNPTYAAVALLVGEPGHDVARRKRAPNVGRVHYFVKPESGVWSDEHSWTSQTFQSDSEFSATMSVSNDGQVLATSSWAQGDGAVHVSKLGVVGPSFWTAAGDLEAGDDAVAAGSGTPLQFGRAIYMCSYGKHVVVGAPAHGDARGAVFEFEETDDVWARRRWYLAPPSSRQFAGQFGSAVSCSTFGNTVLIGAHTTARVFPQNLPEAGAVYVSRYSDAPTPAPSVPVTESPTPQPSLVESTATVAASSTVAGSEHPATTTVPPSAAPSLAPVATGAPSPVTGAPSPAPQLSVEGSPVPVWVYGAAGGGAFLLIVLALLVVFLSRRNRRAGRRHRGGPRRSGRAVGHSQRSAGGGASMRSVRRGRGTSLSNAMADNYGVLPMNLSSRSPSRASSSKAIYQMPRPAESTAGNGIYKAPTLDRDRRMTGSSTGDYGVTGPTEYGNAAMFSSASATETEYQAPS